MRTDSRCGFRFCFALLGAVCLIPSAGFGQVRESNQTITSVPPSPMEASPLSQFSATAPLIKQMNQARRVAGGWLSAPVLTLPTRTQPLVTKDIDLKNTLRKYAAFKKCSLNEAFAETVSFLKMVPLHDKSGSEMVGAQAIYSIVKQDIYRISAQQKFFDALPTNLLCLENGKRYLQIEIHFLGIPTENPETFRSLMVPGSFTSFNNKIPQATPYATTASYKNESASGKLSSPGGTFVVATETKTKVYPTFMGRLDDTGVKKLLAALDADKNIKMTMAPSLVVLPGQTASVADASSRPFVVGMNRVEGDFAIAHQPIIQPIEEGTMLMLRANGENGKIRLDADLALSEIESVETFGYSDFKRNGPLAGSEKTATPVTIQIPEQKLKQVHFSTLVEEGHTVFIDPVFQRNIQTRIEKRMNALNDKEEDNKNPKSRIMLMIKPSWVEAK
jgi:hypothetical protein